MQGDAEDRKKLRAADKAKLKEMDVERDIDQRLLEAEEMATMGLTCAAPHPPYSNDCKWSLCCSITKRHSRLLDKLPAD